MFHPSRCITSPFLKDEAIRRGNTNTGKWVSLQFVALNIQLRVTAGDRPADIKRKKGIASGKEGTRVLHCFMPPLSDSFPHLIYMQHVGY